MNKQIHLAAWDQLRMRHGILLRVIDQMSDAQLTSNPIAGMRTPAEIVVHIYGSARSIVEAVASGTFGQSDEAATAAGIKTRAQLLAFVNQTWAAADATAQKLTDAQLGAMIPTPWGKAFPGFAMVGFIHDEFLHHRGQIYAFVRVFGMEPVMVWDFEHNAPEFQPKVAVKA